MESRDMRVVVRLHRHGRLAQPGLRALARSVRYAEAHGLRVETVLVLDRPDDATRAYVAGASVVAELGATVVDATECGPGEARNRGFDGAATEWVAALDAGDLVTEQWLQDAVAALRAVPGGVAHPGLILHFDGVDAATPVGDSRSEGFDPRSLWEANLWPDTMVTRLQTLRSTPYAAALSDDLAVWHWNAETLRAGAAKVVVPDSVVFRRWRGRDNGAERHLLPRSALFTSAAVATGAAPLEMSVVRARVARAGLEGLTLIGGNEDGTVDLGWAKEALGLDDDRVALLGPAEFNAAHYRVLHLDIGHLPYRELLRHYVEHGRSEGRRALLNADELRTLQESAFDPAEYIALHADLGGLPLRAGVYHYLKMGKAEGRPVRGQRRGGAPAVQMTGPMLESWRAAHFTEPSIFYPSERALAAFPMLPVPDEKKTGAASSLYWSLVGALPERVDALVVAAGLRMTGGDSVVLRYLRVLSEQRPDWSIAVLLTRSDPPTRLDEVPEGVAVVRFAAMANKAGVSDQGRRQVLAALMRHYRPELIHAVNSQTACDVLEQSGEHLAQHSRLALTTFLMKLGWDDRSSNHLVGRRPDFLDPVTVVTTDARALVDELHEMYCYDLEKFAVHYQPATFVRPMPDVPATPRRKVLWAGRFDRQKRLDVLADVAEELQRRGIDVELNVYGQAVLADHDPSRDLARLRAAGAVIHPPYARIEDLPLDEFALFVMTTENEGMPNAMLEMAGSGIPIVAPLVGGIPEFLSDTTGFPVSRTEAVGEYADIIGAIVADPAEAHRRAVEAHALVDRQFSWEAFERAVVATPGYLRPLH